MKIVSKRGKPPAAVKKEEAGSSLGRSIIIITDSSGSSTPEQIKAAEEMFREIRRQLEEIGKIIS